MSLDLLKAFGPDCIPVVVLKNCEPELSYILAELFNKCLKQSCFPDFWNFSSVFHLFKNVVEQSSTKNYCPVILLSLEKLVSNRISITQRNVVFFLISSMVLGCLDELQIFLQFYLIELLGRLTGLGLLELQHLIYSRLLTGFGMLVFFTSLNVVEFQVRYQALFLPFSVIDGFKMFWMAILHKNIQLMLEFLGPTLFCYMLMTFLMMLSVILLSMLMILLSKCDQAFDLWQPLELACEL